MKLWKGVNVILESKIRFRSFFLFHGGEEAPLDWPNKNSGDLLSNPHLSFTSHACPSIGIVALNHVCDRLQAALFTQNILRRCKTGNVDPKLNLENDLNSI